MDWQPSIVANVANTKEINRSPGTNLWLLEEQIHFPKRKFRFSFNFLLSSANLWILWFVNNTCSQNIQDTFSCSKSNRQPGASYLPRHGLAADSVTACTMSARKSVRHSGTKRDTNRFLSTMKEWAVASFAWLLFTNGTSAGEYLMLSVTIQHKPLVIERRIQMLYV